MTRINIGLQIKNQVTNSQHFSYFPFQYFIQVSKKVNI